MAERITINLSQGDANQRKRGPVPEGDYRLRIVKIDRKHPKSGDNTKEWMYALRLRVVDGEHVDRMIFDNVMLWNGAHYALTDLMEALGYEIVPGVLEVPTEEELFGREVDATVTIEDNEYRGKVTKQNRVKYLPMDGDAPKATETKTKVPLGAGRKKLGSS